MQPRGGNDMTVTFGDQGGGGGVLESAARKGLHLRRGGSVWLKRGLALQKTRQASAMRGAGQNGKLGRIDPG